MSPFPPDIQQFVEHEIALGHYSSLDELIQDGVRLLKAQNERRQQIEIAVKEGLDQLDNGEFTEYDDVGLLQFRDEIKNVRVRH